MQIASAFMQYELNSSECLCKGWLMANYPKSRGQLSQFLKLRQDPCMVSNNDKDHLR